MLLQEDITAMSAIPEESSDTEAKLENTAQQDTEELDTAPGVLLYNDPSVADDSGISLVTQSDLVECSGRKQTEDVMDIDTPSCSYTSSTFGSLSSSNYEAIMQEIKIEIHRLEAILLSGTELEDHNIQTEIQQLKEDYNSIVDRFNPPSPLDSLDWGRLSEEQIQSLQAVRSSGLMVSQEDLLKLENMLRFGGCQEEDVQEILTMVEDHLKTTKQQQEEEEVKEEELDKIMEDLAVAMSPTEDNEQFRFTSQTTDEMNCNTTDSKRTMQCSKVSAYQNSEDTKATDLSNTASDDSILDDLCAVNKTESDNESLGDLLESNQEPVPNKTSDHERASCKGPPQEPKTAKDSGRTTDTEVASSTDISSTNSLKETPSTSSKTSSVRQRSHGVQDSQQSRGDTQGTAARPAEPEDPLDSQSLERAVLESVFSHVGKSYFLSSDFIKSERK